MGVVVGGVHELRIYRDIAGTDERRKTAEGHIVVVVESRNAGGQVQTAAGVIEKNIIGDGAVVRAAAVEIQTTRAAGKRGAVLSDGIIVNTCSARTAGAKIPGAESLVRTIADDQVVV